MVNRPLFLQGLDDSSDGYGGLPSHQFSIEHLWAAANIERLPNFRLMVIYTIGKFPVQSPVCIDKMGRGPATLGFFFGDVVLKLARPYPVYGSQPFVADPNQGLLLDIADGMMPLSPATSLTWTAMLERVGEFLEIALNQPRRLPAIITSIDALTNERLTERARAILLTGDDPGYADLWESADALQRGEDRHE